MSEPIALNVVAILCATSLGFFFGPTREFGNFGRVWAAYATFIVTAGVSGLGWAIFVAAHFIGRYW